MFLPLLFRSRITTCSRLASLVTHSFFLLCVGHTTKVGASVHGQVPVAIAWSASERRGNNFKGFKNFYLEVRARIWPSLSYMCQILSTPVDARHPALSCNHSHLMFVNQVEAPIKGVEYLTRLHQVRQIFGPCLCFYRDPRWPVLLRQGRHLGSKWRRLQQHKFNDLTATVAGPPPTTT